jgi:TonB family protein
VQSTGHDANLAALHASNLPGYVLDVVVLTSDGGLLATMRDASSPEHAIWHAPSADAAVDLLVGGRCGMLIADLGTLRGDAASLLARLHSQFPELVLMVTGRRDEESTVASLVGDGRIYRFLHKPISPARASLFLGAATRRYFELRNDEPLVLSTVKTIAQRPHAGKIAAAIAAIAALSTVGLIWLFATDKELPATLQAPIADGPSQAQQVEDQLGRANMAYATGRLFEPRGDNALEYYRDVLALSPNHPEAQAGVERVIEALEQRVVAALEARNPAQGAVALTALQRAQPDHPRLAQLQNELVTLSRSYHPAAVASTPSVRADDLSASASVPVAASQKPAPGTVAVNEEETLSVPAQALSKDLASAEEIESSARAVDAEAMEQLALAVSLRERDMLIAPVGNNAFEYMQSLVAQYPDLDGVRTEQQRLALTLLEHTRTSLAAQQPDDAAAFLDRAEQLVPGMAAAQTLRTQLQQARGQHEFATSIVQAGALKRTREVAAEYPLNARLRGTEGWVDIEFTIAPDGRTQDLVVRNANPPSVFDKSAVEALRRWRFEPILRNGQSISQRATLRLKYELED